MKIVDILFCESSDQKDLLVLSVRPEWAECHIIGSAKLKMSVYGKNAKQSCDISSCTGGFLGEGHKDLEV